MKKNKADIIDENERLRMDIDRLRNHANERIKESAGLRLNISRAEKDNNLLKFTIGELTLELAKVRDNAL